MQHTRSENLVSKCELQINSFVMTDIEDEELDIYYIIERKVRS